ncbi:MAG: sel1 repeat family protein, partial [Candidatus Methanomethylophilaceae archaeon]|nr:sel1 repeat family protein [Candidatus Methanomethylophilaceae archaeon]
MTMTQPANQDLAELELERRKSIRAVKRFDSILNNGPESKKKRLADVVRPYAKPSFPEALIRMSIVYRDGYGVDQDLDEAIEWMQKASDAGSEKGAWNLFNLLLQRDGPGDRKRMFELVNAFEGTGSNAMTILLAESYVEGYGTDVNVDKALELLSKVDRESSKKNEIKYKAVLKALQSGQDVKGVIKKANLPESDKKAIKKLLSESENDLLELLIQTYLEQPTDYAGGLESKNAKSTIRSDCQKLLDVLSSTKEWGIIASPRAISRTLNSMIDSSKERGHMSDKGVVPLFVSLEIKNKYLKEQHEGLYVILSYFDKICKTYDIKYFVSCGTL